MALNIKGLLTPHGVFKIIELVLVIVTFLIARVGYDGYTASFGSTLDHTWLGYLTVGGWLIIIPAIIVGIVLGDPVSWRMDSLLSLVGACLYIASGSCAIDYHTNTLNNKSRDTGLALGSFCIITGIVMVMDAAMVVFKYGRKGGSITK